MTNTQKQNLLSYLGYYDGAVDGKWGEQSINATRKFQIDFGGLDADGVVGSNTENALRHAVFYGMPEKKAENETPSFWDEIKHFKRSEFACKCGKYCNGFPVEPDEKLVRFLDGLREKFGVPVTITSGVRCRQHNANVNGASRSQHMLGNAADIKVRGVDPVDVYEYADEEFGKSGGVGLYKSFTHVDVRSTKSRWNG